MKKFNELYAKIISEMTENLENPEPVENSEELVLTPEEVCKDQGYANSCSYNEEFAKKFNAAQEAHKKMMEEHPEEHDLQEYTIGNCLHEYACKCGYSYKVDSSRIILKIIKNKKGET